MKNGYYETRRYQIEAAGLRVICAAHKRKGPRQFRAIAKQKLRLTAFIGACAERDHALKMIAELNTLTPAQKRYVSELICSKSVLEVLGYPE